jgi:hypothetical protein
MERHGRPVIIDMGRRRTVRLLVVAIVVRRATRSTVVRVVRRGGERGEKL